MWNISKWCWRSEADLARLNILKLFFVSPQEGDSSPSLALGPFTVRDMDCQWNTEYNCWTINITPFDIWTCVAWSNKNFFGGAENGRKGDI